MALQEVQYENFWRLLSEIVNETNGLTFQEKKAALLNSIDPEQEDETNLDEFLSWFPERL